MEKKKPQCHHPMCKLSHELLGKLSVIVGSCDLLEEEQNPAEHDTGHLARIRSAAQEMAEKLRSHQCRFALLLETEEQYQRGDHLKPII